jgi:hypothetical protein
MYPKEKTKNGSSETQSEYAWNSNQMHDINKKGKTKNIKNLVILEQMAYKICRSKSLNIPWMNCKKSYTPDHW